MKTQIRLFGGDSSVLFEKENGWYCVQSRGPDGEVHNKIRCDRYADGIVQFKEFCEEAEELWGPYK